jgi:hypothetical protein
MRRRAPPAPHLAHAEPGLRRRHPPAPVRHLLVRHPQLPVAACRRGGGGAEARGGAAAELPRTVEGVADVGEGPNNAADLVDRDAAVGGEGGPGVEDGGAGELAQAGSEGV